MREILFRGKRTDNGEWVEGSLIQRDLGCFIVDESNRQSLRYCSEFVFAFDCLLVKSETVGQYTGLTDKNGKKIFEGDIIKDCYGRIEQCYYNKARYRLVFDGTHYTRELEFANEVEYEVIGNIHDNPELLKGGVEE